MEKVTTFFILSTGSEVSAAAFMYVGACKASLATAVRIDLEDMHLIGKETLYSSNLPLMIIFPTCLIKSFKALRYFVKMT